jgi:triosephosphate isomerase
MNKERKLIIAGNWKMNKTVTEATDLVAALDRDLGAQTEVDVVVCPPFTALDAVSKLLKNSLIKVGAQNMSEKGYGAFTGEINAGMLRDLRVHYVILGHSERREYQKETNALINTKTKAALAAEQIAGSLSGLKAEQIKDTIIAYEPVWAIGTGKTANSEQAQEVHAYIRSEIAKIHGPETAQTVRIQYGGSVKSENAQELLSQPDIDGALVGGASLESRGFSDIINSTRN